MNPLVKIPLFVTLATTTLTVFAQKKIILSKYPKEVPTGKKWVLRVEQENQIEVSYGVLNSGSLCNARFLSNPHVIDGVVEGRYGRPNEVYGILFETVEKVPYTNEYTYLIVPKAIVPSGFDFSELQTKPVDKVGLDEIAFLSGENVFVGNCLSSVQLVELDLTREDLLKIQKRDQAKIKEQAIIAEKELYIKKNQFYNFSIPVNSEKYIAPGTVPEIHDEKINQIEFQINGTVFRQEKEKEMSLDESKWEMSLSNNGLSFGNENESYKRSFKVISYTFDEKMSAARFELSEDNLNVTHLLFTSWLPSSNRYSLLLNSVNGPEEFQFQDAQAASKNGIEIDIFPRIVDSKLVSEDFFIKKKKSGDVKAYWVNEDKRVTNYYAFFEHAYYRNQISYTAVDDLKILSELISQIKSHLQEKVAGDYFIGFDVEEERIETAKGIFDTKRKVAIDQFFKGMYNNPEEIYKK